MLVHMKTSSQGLAASQTTLINTTAEPKLLFKLEDKLLTDSLIKNKEAKKIISFRSSCPGFSSSSWEKLEWFGGSPDVR